MLFPFFNAALSSVGLFFFFLATCISFFKKERRMIFWLTLTTCQPKCWMRNHFSSAVCSFKCLPIGLFHKLHGKWAENTQSFLFLPLCAESGSPKSRPEDVYSAPKSSIKSIFFFLSSPSAEIRLSLKLTDVVCTQGYTLLAEMNNSLLPKH